MTLRPAVDSPRLWTVLCTVLAVGALAAGLAPPGLRESLDWQPTRWAGQPWRWWTAAVVHWSLPHLIGNLAGLAVVAALGCVTPLSTGLALAWAASWPLTHLALLTRPELAHYGGLSGVLHGAVAVAALALMTQPDNRRRSIGAAIAVGLTLKITLENPMGPTLRPLEGWHIAAAPFAHLAGALAGAGCAAVVLIRQRWRSKQARDARN